MFGPSDLLSWLPTLRLADVVDIAVVTAFVYVLVRWVRRSRSRFVLSGLAAIAGVYFAARALDMYLTLFLFQLGLTVALLALVVIFQEDIRRAFERLAMNRWLRRQRTPQGLHELIMNVVQATDSMAKERTGALMVFKGRDPLERHLTGGNALNGRVSLALLLSVFDSSSPGHDGAVVFDRGLITHFGVHLPLSAEHDALGGHGTRHAAALGISERSDAFVVVVSEERGTISVAQHGELKKHSAPELKVELERFLASLGTVTETGGGVRDAFATDWGTKLGAFGVALAAWIAVQGRASTTLERTIDVPVVYRAVPEKFSLDVPDAQRVSITLRGTVRAFGHLDTSAQALSIPGKALRGGAQKIAVSEELLALPEGIELISASPSRIQVVAHPTEVVSLPIRAKLVGELTPGRRLVTTTVTPTHTQLRIRRQDRDRFDSVTTEAVDLSNVGVTRTFTVELDLPPDARLTPDAPGVVDVTLETRPTR
ncbi:MAG: diadenylate cyclase [Polyangiaceae bacterium]|nr:diadenylate cyclase [Polyangiaceae bacterium]